jgi:hypothetical protein
MSKRRFPFPFSIFHSPSSILHSPSSILHFIHRYVSWGVIDALIVAVSLLLAWLARAVTAALDIRPALPFGLVAIAVCLDVNYLFRLYHRMWRYASAGEIVVIAAAVLTSTAVLIQQGFAALGFFGAFPTVAASLEEPQATSQLPNQESSLTELEIGGI